MSKYRYTVYLNESMFKHKTCQYVTKLYTNIYAENTNIHPCANIEYFNTLTNTLIKHS